MRARRRLDELLEEAPQWTGGKQRLTAARLHRMLVEDGLSVGETLVKEHVREWKRKRREVFVPLSYAPGDLAQVDFFEVLADIGGERTKAWMFVMRLMHSKRDFAHIYPRQDQVCFLDGHVRAFSHFGAVPLRIAYDNLKPAMARMIAGSERELSLASRRCRATTCLRILFDISVGYLAAFSTNDDFVKFLDAQAAAQGPDDKIAELLGRRSPVSVRAVADAALSHHRCEPTLRTAQELAPTE